MTAPLEAFPTAVRGPWAAPEGPPVDGEPLRQGDVLAGPEGPLVVVGTRRGPANGGVELFDPARHRRRVVGSGDRNLESPVRRRALGVVRTVADERVTLWYASYVPETDRFRCAVGRAPLGATVVGFEATTAADTRAGLRARLDPPVAGESALSGFASPEVEADLTRLAEAVATAERPAGERDTPALATDGVAIPTGEADLIGGPGPTVLPGDRLVYWPDRRPPRDPLSAGAATLSAGRCEVVLDGTTLYDLAGGGRERVDPGTLTERFERARERGLVLRLLARDCHVAPIGRAHTDSLHVYEAHSEKQTALACGDRQTTATPRLEHPLALPVETDPDLERLADRLRTGGGPLEPWTDEESTEQLCERVARRALENAARRPDCEV